MSKSSILGGERAPVYSSGRGADLLGPSDSSDSGSDSIGELGPDQLASDSDRSGTGERGSVDLMDSSTGADILPDHIDRASVGGDSGDADARELDQLAVDEDDDDDESEDEAGDRPSA
ncbi:MAG: hypothetical protein LH617_06105 [Ramlibacter sp.]|nr:hypothetical protein [Ramlibacter sp.]